MTIEAIVEEARAEVAQASENWPAWNSAHEGFAILLEEVDELKAHVWTKQKNRDVAAMRKEAIQVAAMAMRFAHDICDGGRARN
jgi:NTP pyrophosphatase (non-canonical NTP hydrolase)